MVVAFVMACVWSVFDAGRGRGQTRMTNDSAAVQRKIVRAVWDVLGVCTTIKDHLPDIN